VIKIWFMLILISMPNTPTVKYNGFLYPNEDDCRQAQLGFLNAYESKPQDYKDKLVVDAFCLPFDAFPVQGMNYQGTKFGV